MKRIIIFLSLIIVTLGAKALGVHLFTSDNDLSSSLINQVFVDSEGFVWIATESGLNRYDGSKVTIYKKKPGSANCLAHDYVNSVFESSKGDLLVGTHAGIQLYDRLTDSFTAQGVNTDGTPYTGAVSEIFELPDGRLISIGNRVCELEIEPGRIVMKRMPYSDKVENVSHGAVDNQGNLWLALNHRGLQKITRNNKITNYFDNSGDIVEVAVGPDGTVYVGDSDGSFYVYNAVADTFSLIDSDLGNSIITNIYPYTNGTVYISTDGGGLYGYNKSRGRVERIPLPMWHDRSLKIHSMAKDAYDNTWIGIYQKGVLMVPSTDSAFNTIDQRSPKNVYIGQSCVSALLRDSDGTLWIGTDNDGIYSVSPDMNQSRHYSEGVPKVVMRMARDSRGNLWVGSYDAGMGILDPVSGSYRRINSSNGEHIDKVYAFAETPDNELWIATMGSGLYRHNLNTGLTEDVTKVNPDINMWISDIVYSPVDKHLYLGTYDGLFKVNPVSLETIPVTRGMIVTTIFEDRDAHSFWLGMPSGLALSYGGNMVSKVFTTGDGLPSNTIYAIRKSGNSLWISTNYGISQFNLDSKSFVNYDVNEGLQSNEFYKNSACIDNEGTLFFGGINGVTYFKPENITSSGRKLDLRITDFYIGGVSVKNGMESGGRPVITEPIHKAKTFYLSPDDNSFSIEFASKQFASSSITDFYYSFDNEPWEKLPKGIVNLSLPEANLLTFSNVKSGRHTLRIKAVDNGVESDEISVDIIVARRWFATWWAYLIYFVLAASVIFLVYRQIHALSLRKQAELARKHEEDIKEAKLQFFTNISHEIRTPLTLVMSPLQKLMGEDADSVRQRVYRTILRNSQRIHKLVDELLDLRKIDNKQMRLHFREVDVDGFMHDLYETFLPAATSKDITLTYINTGCEGLKAWVDPSNFDKIVMNLLSNAVKYTPRNGTIEIRLSKGSDSKRNDALKQYLQIDVVDTGCGIPNADKANIFERFYQCDNNKIGGTGIGLHLTHSLVKMHHGEIEANDNPTGKGTCFTVRLPLGRDHLVDSEIDTSVSEGLINKRIIEMNSIIADQTVTPDPEKNMAPSSRRLIYIVDDDSEVRTFLVQTLGEKFRVEAFANGAEALEGVHNNVPDLIITDVMMPEMDGLTLAAKIRQNVNFNHIPVIMLTAKNREEDTIDGLDTGADAYITKPFNVDILVRTVRNLLDNRRILRNVYGGSQDQMNKVEEIKVMSNDEKLLDRIMKVINKNLSNPNITVEMIAQEIGISRVHLHRKLKELTNQSTRDFIRNIRLQQAAKMLREKKLTVAEVSDLVGFKHPNNFSTNFKEMFGMSPSAYAEKHHS